MSSATLAERISSDPFSAYAACLVVIPVAIWVYSMIGWSITQDIDPWFGLPAAGVGIGLGIATISPPIPGFGPVFFLAIVAMMVAYPFVRKAARSHMVTQIQLHEMNRAYEALRQRPDHASAQLKLAETLYLRGYIHQALAVADAALKKLPQNYYAAEHKMVAEWRRHTNVAAPTEIRCLSCGTLNNPASPFCMRCREPYLLYHARGSWFGGTRVAPILGFWLVGTLAVVGLPTVAMMPVSIPLRIILIICILAVAVFALIKSLGLLQRSEAA